MPDLRLCIQYFAHYALTPAPSCSSRPDLAPHPGATRRWAGAALTGAGPRPAPASRGGTHSGDMGLGGGQRLVGPVAKPTTDETGAIWSE